jgi:hypothetical protein
VPIVRTYEVEVMVVRIDLFDAQRPAGVERQRRKRQRQGLAARARSACANL